jgi:hypothetical protein
MASELPEPKGSRKGDGGPLSLKRSAFQSPPMVPHPRRATDYFLQAAKGIDELSRTDPDAARDRWWALKNSAATDGSGADPPDIFDAGQIAVSINYPVLALVRLHIVLSIRESYDYGQTRPELRDALPPSLGSYERSFLSRFGEVLGRGPYNYGTKKRVRYAVTYAELLHMAGVPGLELVEKLDKPLLHRLEAL